MSPADQQRIRRSLIRHVFNYTKQRPDFGLVTEFGRRTQWIGRPDSERTGNELSELKAFLARVKIEPLHEDLTNFFKFLFGHHNQPRAVRALNTIAEREGLPGGRDCSLDITN